MANLVISASVVKELEDVKRYPAKIFRQLALRIFDLSLNPYPPDAKKIGNGFRVDSGEYRIYYEIDNPPHTITILLVGKRGDDEIYRRLKQKFGR